MQPVRDNSPKASYVIEYCGIEIDPAIRPIQIVQAQSLQLQLRYALQTRRQCLLPVPEKRECTHKGRGSALRHGYRR